MLLGTYPHTNAHVHYIKTNNKLYLQSVCVCCYVVFCRIQPPNYHHRKTDYLCQITTTTKVWLIFAVFVFVSYAVADIWMMIYVLSLRRVPCVEVLHILFMLVLSLFSLLYSGMQFWILCTTLIEHYISSALLCIWQIFCSWIFIHWLSVWKIES